MSYTQTLGSYPRAMRGFGADAAPPDATVVPAAVPAVVATQTIGWLALGGVVGAALWALGHEIASVHRGQR